MNKNRLNIGVFRYITDEEKRATDNTINVKIGDNEYSGEAVFCSVLNVDHSSNNNEAQTIIRGDAINTGTLMAMAETVIKHATNMPVSDTSPLVSLYASICAMGEGMKAYLKLAREYSHINEYEKILDILCATTDALNDSSDIIHERITEND